MIGTQDEHLFIDMKLKANVDKIGAEKSDREK